MTHGGTTLVRRNPRARTSGVPLGQQRPSKRARRTAGTVDQLGDGTQPGQPDKSPHHPVVVAEQAQRAADLQLRIADWITAFAGSMPFVYIHIALFAMWMLFIESKPWPALTLIVSLEAIFLSTFVMIGQNRQSEFQQAKADHDFNEQELELKTNTELTREIHRLTTELHERLLNQSTQQP
jgi:low affinity Fe/Cu permease